MRTKAERKAVVNHLMGTDPGPVLISGRVGFKKVDMPVVIFPNGPFRGVPIDQTRLELVQGEIGQGRNVDRWTATLKIHIKDRPIPYLFPVTGRMRLEGLIHQLGVYHDTIRPQYVKD